MTQTPSALSPDLALLYIVLLPLFGAIFNGLVGRKLSRRVVTVFGCGTVGAAFGLSVYLFSILMGLKGQGVEDPAIRATLFDWIHVGQLQITASFLLDSLSAVMLLVVTGVGFLIHVYSTGYMADDPGYGRYFAYLNLFMFSMLMLVLGDSLGLLFLGWEGVGLCSYLLIGFWFDDAAKAKAGQKAFVVNRIGDFAFLIALIILLVYTGGSLRFHAMASTFEPGAPASAVLPLVTLLLFVGAIGKSAQIPLYIWLPDAMAGPTPVSALIHAATMVTAGVYMVCRLNFLYVQAPLVMALIAIIGAATALYAASVALTQRDIKKVLAYSTVSQLGYMFLAAGVGAFSAAIFHLMTHAFFKACLFLGAGAVIHALHGEQDGFKMGGLGKHLPTTRWTFLAATLAIAGFPLLSGFFSKDEILFSAFAYRHAGGVASLQLVAFGLGLFAALLTAFYMGRLYRLIFSGAYRGDRHLLEHLHKPSFGMKLALVVLGLLAIGGGWIGLPAEHWNRIHHWLEPIFADSAGAFQMHGGHAVEYGLMGVSTLIALAGLAIAWRWYGRGPLDAPARLAERYSGLYNLSLEAYRVDALVERFIKRPFGGLARFCYEVVDSVIIDGFIVNGAARFVGGVGDLLRRFQTGDVQQYALGIVLGTAALIYFLAT